MKTSFTHEGLIERGFNNTNSDFYIKIIGNLKLWTDSAFKDHIANLIVDCHGEHGFVTNITTLEDLDTFLSFIK